MPQTNIKQQSKGESGVKKASRRIKFLTLTEESQMKIFAVINRAFLALAVCAAIGAGGTTLAQHTGNDQVKVSRLSRRDIIEKLDGKAASVTMEEVYFEPGQKDWPHRHTGAVFGYVIEGEYEHALDDEPVRIYKVGDTFYEPSGSVHRVARNPSDKTGTRLLAVFVHPRDAVETTIPVKSPFHSYTRPTTGGERNEKIQ